MKTCKTCKYKNEDNDCEAITEESEIASVYTLHACHTHLVEWVTEEYLSVTDDFGCVLHEEKKWQRT